MTERPKVTPEENISAMQALLLEYYTHAASRRREIERVRTELASSEAAITSMRWRIEQAGGTPVDDPGREWVLKTTITKEETIDGPAVPGADAAADDDV